MTKKIFFSTKRHLAVSSFAKWALVCQMVNNPGRITGLRLIPLNQRVLEKENRKNDSLSAQYSEAWIKHMKIFENGFRDDSSLGPTSPVNFERWGLELGERLSNKESRPFLRYRRWKLMQDVGFAPMGLFCTHRPPVAFLGPHCVRCKPETRSGPSSLDAFDVSKMNCLLPSMATMIR